MTSSWDTRKAFGDTASLITLTNNRAIAHLVSFILPDEPKIFVFFFLKNKNRNNTFKNESHNTSNYRPSQYNKARKKTIKIKKGRTDQSQVM